LGGEGCSEGFRYSADEAPDAHGDSDYLVVPVAHGAEAVQRAIDAGPVIRAEAFDAVNDVVQVVASDELIVGQVVVTGLGLQGAPEVDGDLFDVVGLGFDCFGNPEG
jgi:hypothetical protein